MKNGLYAGLAFFVLLGATGIPSARSNAATAGDTQAAQKQSQDWADLGHYRHDNAIVKPPAEGESRVVFMGDSITDFWGRAPGTVLFRQTLYQSRYQRTNHSADAGSFRAGRRSAQTQGSSDPGGHKRHCGKYRSDEPEDTENNFIAMTDIARQNGIRVVLSSLTPAFQYPWRPGIQPVEKISALNAWLKDYAAKNGLFISITIPRWSMPRAE